jgi:tetratricopeptide (TPR) repeat protein
MSFDDGMKEFKRGRYFEAARHFAAVTDADDQNHKAWNALGICLSKTGEYGEADICFENALTLQPDNETYKKNKLGNDRKRTVQEPDLELGYDSSPVRSQARPVSSRSAGSIFMSLVKIGLGIFVFLIILVVIAAIIAGMSGSSGSSVSATPKISPTEIMSQAQSVSYEELARYPAKYKGKPIYMRGQVSQVLDSFGGVNLRVFTKESDFSAGSYYENDIFVDYPSPKERILEKDVITIYGYADGIQEYQTVLGAQRSIPKLKAVTHTR